MAEKSSNVEQILKNCSSRSLKNMKKKEKQFVLNGTLLGPKICKNVILKFSPIYLFYDADILHSCLLRSLLRNVSICFLVLWQIV